MRWAVQIRLRTHFGHVLELVHVCVVAVVPELAVQAWEKDRVRIFLVLLCLLANVTASFLCLVPSAKPELVALTMLASVRPEINCSS